jgi:hypothetical protein
MIRRTVRTVVTRTIDARLPVRIALGAGAVITWVVTFLVARAVHLSADWKPAAAAATAGWFTLVVFGVTVAEIVQIQRNGPEIMVQERERHRWSRPWVPPVILVVGIVLGWLYFK